MTICCRHVVSIIVICQSLLMVAAAVSFSASNIPSCLTVSRLRGNVTITDTSQTQRIIVIGDIHGDQRGFFEILYASGITRSLNECAWKLPQNSKIHTSHIDAGFSYDGTLFVQTGDVVDRGPNTLGVLACLDQLQQSAPMGSKVIRTLGNHDLMWLEGDFNYKNKADTPLVLATAVRQMKHAIAGGSLVGSYLHWVNGLPLFFVHAGLRPAMLTLIDKEISKETSSTLKSGDGGGDGTIRSSGSGSLSGETIVNYINDHLRISMASCLETNSPSPSPNNHINNENTDTPLLLNPSPKNSHRNCEFTHPLYQAGPERGNKNGAIGGPFWTDYAVLEESEASMNVTHPLTPFVQIVGHTIHLNKIKTTRLFGAVGIDSGMYIGGRAYLEISPSARFYAWEKEVVKTKDKHGDKSRRVNDPEQSQPLISDNLHFTMTVTNSGKWSRRDLSSLVCDGTTG